MVSVCWTVDWGQISFPTRANLKAGLVAIKLVKNHEERHTVDEPIIASCLVA